MRKRCDKSHPITQEILEQLLEYNPTTGEVFWKERGSEWIEREASRKTWNTRYAGKPVGNVNSVDGYLRASLLGSVFLVHRLVWMLVSGDWPRNEIDHINGDRADNRWANLRDVPRLQNAKNMKRNSKNTSGRAGLYWIGRVSAWRVNITVGRKVLFLGYYKNYEEAVKVRSAAERANGFHENHDREVA